MAVGISHFSPTDQLTFQVTLFLKDERQKNKFSRFKTAVRDGKMFQIWPLRNHRKIVFDALLTLLLCKISQVGN